MSRRRWILCTGSILLIIVAAAINAQSRMDVLQEATIVYIADDAVANDLTSTRSTTSITERLPVVQVDNWDDFAQSASPNLQALIIDISASDTVDRTALASLYQQGIVIAGFNITVNDFSRLIGDTCFTYNGFASEAYPGSFYLIASQLILGNIQSDVDEALPARRSGCFDAVAANITNLVSVYSGRSTYSLDTAEDLNVFYHVLTNHIQDVAETRRDFATQSNLQVPLGDPANQ